MGEIESAQVTNDQWRELRVAALNLLARREHSRAELIAKLASRAERRSVLEAVLDQLAAEGLQCDRRFAVALLRSRVARGQGAYRVRQELRQRGLADDLIEAAIEDAEVDWFELAAALALRRFGREPAADPKGRAKRMRFLQYRGFSIDQIQCALSRGDD